MNIVVFGGGTVGKFGHDFCLKAREQGHNVVMFSHTSNGTGDQQQHIIYYNNIAKTNNVIQKVLLGLESIDIVLFNQKGDNFPREKELWQLPDINQYQTSFNSHIVVPHLFMALAKNKLKDTSKVINMGTNLAWVYDIKEVSQLVGYSSGKSYLTHYIQALARNRENNTTFFTLCPSMDYNKEEDKQIYPAWCDALTKFILTCTDEYNGEIVFTGRVDEFSKQIIRQNQK